MTANNTNNINQTTTYRTTAKKTKTTRKPTGQAETQLRAAARRHGLTMKELAHRMGISNQYLSMLSTGKVAWSPAMKEKVIAVLGEVPGQGVVYRQTGYVSGESTCIRERAREMGLSLNELAERAGVSSRHLTNVSRGRSHLGVKVQRRVEELLQAPAQAAPASKPNVDCRALWERMDAHGISQNEVARRAGISKGYLSDLMAGRRVPSGGVLKRLHQTLFAPSPAELVAPVELKVLGWKKGKRNGVVIRGAGGPGGDSIRVGGRVPWGAQVEYAYTTGYDGHGRVSVNRLVDERGCSALLQRAEADSD